MTLLGEWLRKLIGAAVILGFLELILPEGEMRRFARVVMGLLALLLMLQPLAALVHQSPALDRILAGPPPAVPSSSPGMAETAARVSAAGLEALQRAQRSALEQDVRQFAGGAAVTVTAGRDGRPHVLIRLRDGGDPSRLQQAIASRYGLPETAIEVRTDE